MPEGVSISKGNFMLLLCGVLVSAFLGVTLGNYYTRSKFEAAAKKKLLGGLMLKVGQEFPDYNFAPLSAERRNLFQTLDDKKSILIFMTSQCPHCVELMKKLNAVYLEISPKYQVAGISFEKVDMLREFQTKESISFPLFDDTLGKFTARYKIDAYPTLVGLNERKKIAFIEFGYNENKDIKEYFKNL